MGLDYNTIIEANKNQIKYVIGEKHILIRKISSTKYILVLLIFLITAFRIFPNLVEDYSLQKSAVISLVVVAFFSLIIILTKNESFLSSKNVKKLNARFKNKTVQYLVKSISDNLVYRPANRVSAKLIRESGLFAHGITDFKGSNLIKGDFNDYSVQTSEIKLIKGARIKFHGVYFYIKGISENQLIEADLNLITKSWCHRGNELYIAIPKKRKQFHLELAESNRSIEKVQQDLKELIQVFSLLNKMTGISFDSTFQVPTEESKGFDDLFGKKSVYTDHKSRREFPLADSTKRVLNFIIDQIAVTAITILIIIIANVQNVEYFFLVLFAVYILYFILLESIFFQSLGKILTKSKVISNSGKKPTLLQILLRTVCRLIPFEQYSFINSNVGLHDRLSKTIVVETKE